MNKKKKNKNKKPNKTNINTPYDEEKNFDSIKAHSSLRETQQTSTALIRVHWENRRERGKIYINSTLWEQKQKLNGNY